MANIPDGFESVALTQDNLRAVLELDQWAFPATESIEDLLALPSPLDWQRSHALVPTDDPEHLAGMHASYPFGHTPVPGGRLPVAGLTWVGVHPQWRRRGLLRAMIAQHFENCRGRDESISMLFAAEPAIYGRFGYGLCARQLSLTMSRGAQLRPVVGADAVTIRIDARTPAHAELISRLHAAVTRPGWVTRESPQLMALFIDDPQVFRDGREAARIMIAERAGEPVGYALFQRKPDWKATGPDGTVMVGEVVAPDAAIAHALWSRLLDLDLTSRVEARMLAIDDPLLSLLVDLRATGPRLQDNTWLRIIDLPAALAGRQYVTPIDVVLQVSDEQLPDNAGRWRLRAPAFGQAQLAPTDLAADLVLDIRELGAAYLGGISLAELAAAGLVEELTEGSLLLASVAFGWPVAPVASWVF
jgi:predicted acetyltransferase